MQLLKETYSAGVEDISENHLRENEILATLMSVSTEDVESEISLEAFEGVKKVFARLNEGLDHNKTLTSIKNTNTVTKALEQTRALYRQRMSQWEAFRKAVVAADVGEIEVKTSRVSEYLSVDGVLVTNLDPFMNENQQFEKIYFTNHPKVIKSAIKDLTAIRKGGKFTSGSTLMKTVIKPTLALGSSADNLGKLDFTKLPSTYIMEIDRCSMSPDEDEITAKMVHRDHLYIKTAPGGNGTVVMKLTVKDIDEMMKYIKTTMSLVDDTLKSLLANSSQLSFFMRGNPVDREMLLELDQTELNRYYAALWTQTRVITSEVRMGYILARRSLEIATALLHLPTAFMREYKYSSESAKQTDWTGIKPLSGDKQIKAVEKKLGHTFDSVYVSFIKTHNNGRPPESTIKTINGKDLNIKKFLSLDTSDKEDILSLNKPVVEVNDKLVAFAIDDFGNYFCFDKETNSIQFLDFETSETELVANTFTEFLKANDFKA